MKLISPKGIEVEVPVGGAHGPVETWLEKGWKLPPPAPLQSPPIPVAELGVATVGELKALVEAKLAAAGFKVAAPEAQDDVAHAAASDPPNVSC